MGGMGRDFDGGYAEYTCVPARQVKVIKTSLPWEILGAIPEMLQTSLGFSVQITPSRQGRALADPRRDDIGRAGRGVNRQKPWRRRRIDNPQA